MPELSRERFSYSLVGPEDAPRRPRPILSLTLIVSERRISFPALVDRASASIIVNSVRVHSPELAP